MTNGRNRSLGASAAASPAAPPRGALAKVAYALIFNLVLPIVLVGWAIRTRDLPLGPSVTAPAAGAMLAALGVVLVVASWWALWHDGGGLPMNAFPPPRLATRGVYRVLAHPIYIGAVAVLVGVAIAIGSASALWLIGPLFGLTTAALVVGHEHEALERRFAGKHPGLTAPAAEPGRADTEHRASYVLCAAVPWLLWSLVQALWAGSAPAPLVYGPTAAASLLPLGLPTQRSLAWVGHAARRALVADVLLTFVTGPRDPVFTLARMGVAIALGVAAGRLWRAARALAELIANSWHEWQWGPVRIISHGIYAALSTAGGVWLVSALVGPGGEATVAVATLGSLVGAALWAQIIEGASGLSRPFGFYGGLLGIVFSALAAPALGVSPWLLLASFTMAAPWIQSVGRLRCLVQGCCHGHAAPAHVGIRHTHPRSRVVRLSTLGGVPIHPTALYSILWNGVTAIVLGRVWASGWPLHAIGGLYLVLGGIGRFVEEAYRGEPQTPIHFGLRLYQWVAIASVLAGIACMSLGSSAAAPSPTWTLHSLPAAITLGLVVGAALGIDFPGSKRRFSRLA